MIKRKDKHKKNVKIRRCKSFRGISKKEKSVSTYMGESKLKSFSPKWQILIHSGKQQHDPNLTSTTLRSLMLSGSHKYSRFTAYVVTLSMNALLTILLFLVGFKYDRVNIAMLYLLPVLISSIRYGIGPGILSACVGLLSFDFFFVPPIFSYTVRDLRFLVSFAVFLTVAILTATLAAKLRTRAEDARKREAITHALYTLSRQLAVSNQFEAIIQLILQHVTETFDTQATIALPDHESFTFHALSQENKNPQLNMDLYILNWVYRHGELAGLGSKLYQSAALLYVPLKVDEMTHGVLCVGEPGNYTLSTNRDHLDMLQAIAGLAAISLARIHFEEQAQLAHLAAESERLRTTFMNSISHELRTPLTTIIGATSGLLESYQVISEGDRLELLSTIHEGALRMNRLVTNLIGMMRIESGMMQLHHRPTDILDTIGIAISNLKEMLLSHPVQVHVESEVPEIEIDDTLFEQVFVNLISNAAKYSNPGKPIEIVMRTVANEILISIRDFGVGIPDDEKQQVFDKFYRGSNVRHIPGTGLGLAICRTVIEAHGGYIEIQNGAPCGTQFIIHLPYKDALSLNHMMDKGVK